MNVCTTESAVISNYHETWQWKDQPQEVTKNHSFHQHIQLPVYASVLASKEGREPWEDLSLIWNGLYLHF